ncbi:1060_t:CDS:2 [Acaulospora morrowiae]|uniref:1060_t:CDS:1 n=1 Tax=Acaulospora morrowiae TaxID=94023 RepID=A0A9N8VZD3_9GLOM|nr:1060_t:CDS:2 [Acaulospora morrowiae]
MAPFAEGRHMRDILAVLESNHKRVPCDVDDDALLILKGAVCGSGQDIVSAYDALCVYDWRDSGIGANGPGGCVIN